MTYLIKYCTVCDIQFPSMSKRRPKKTCPECTKEQKRITAKIFNLIHKADIAINNKIYREENKVKIAAYQKKYHKKQKDKEK